MGSLANRNHQHSEHPSLNPSSEELGSHWGTQSNARRHRPLVGARHSAFARKTRNPSWPREHCRQVQRLHRGMGAGRLSGKVAEGTDAVGLRRRGRLHHHESHFSFVFTAIARATTQPMRLQPRKRLMMNTETSVSPNESTAVLPFGLFWSKLVKVYHGVGINFARREQ